MSRLILLLLLLGQGCAHRIVEVDAACFSVEEKRRAECIHNSLKKQGYFKRIRYAK